MDIFIKKYNIKRTGLKIYDDILNHYAPLVRRITKNMNDEETDMVIKCIKIKQTNNEKLDDYMESYLNTVNRYNDWIADLYMKGKIIEIDSEDE
jgi:hypothetical protein